MKISIEEQRQQFPGLINKNYFNFGGQGTMAKASLDAIISSHKYIQQVGPFSLEINAWIQNKIGDLRLAIAKEFKTTPDTITLTENVTAGCNIVLWGIDWQPGDSILLSDCEHPGVIGTIEEISRRFGVKVLVCPILDTLNQGDPVAVIEQYLQPSTRLVVISHLLWNTGQVLPLKEIVRVCHSYSKKSEQPIQVLVDAAQSVGCLPLNLPELEVDYYAFTGHKWLCGPGGVGGLYISQAAYLTLNPTFIGWRSVEHDSKGNFQGWKIGGEKFEVATSAYAEYEGLRTAIAVHQEWGDSTARYQRICHLSNYLWTKLQQINGITCLKKSPPEAGLVSFQMGEQSCEPIVNNLEKQAFLLRTITYPNCIRACVHYLTLESEIDQFISVLNKIL